MWLSNKDKKYKDYPTKAEYYEEIERIQSEELKSDRYKLAYAFLANNYWNRENKDLEEELFKIIGTYGNGENMFNKSSEYRKTVRTKKYEILKKFIGSLSEEQINSNIFLKRTYSFMNMSNEVCSAIMTELYDKINSETVSNPLPSGLQIQRLQIQIPEKTQKLIPNYICNRRGIKYYRPEAYRIDYTDVLDSTHKYVYEDYNSLALTLGKLAEDVYYLQLNEMVSNNPSLECYFFQVYHPGYNNHFIVSFSVSTKQNIQTSQEINSISTDEFIQTTVANFKQLLNMGLIDVSVLEDENTEYVLKKKVNEKK